MYLDPKYSMWISTDPALGEYIPIAPTNDEAKKHNSNLPGMGGVFNHINFNLYHYAGNSPVKYTDLDGREAKRHTESIGRDKFYKELSDIFGCDIKEGIAGAVKFTLIGFIKAEIGLNAGSFEVTQEKGEIDARDTVGITATVSVLDKAQVTVGSEWKTKAVDSKKMSEHIINAWENGIREDSTSGLVSVKGPFSLSAGQEGNSDIKLEAGIMFGVGFDVWINCTETWDFIKYLYEGGINDLK